MKKRIVCAAILLLVIFSVMLLVDAWQSGGLFHVQVAADGHDQAIALWEDADGNYIVFLPAYADLSKVHIRLDTIRPMWLDEIRITNRTAVDDLTLDHAYTLTRFDDEQVSGRTVTFLQSGNVAAVYIQTVSGSMEYIHEVKGNEEMGSIRVYTAQGELDHAGRLDSIKGRGNYTWYNCLKKPYSVNLAQDADLLGMGSASRWILLANADDESNLRNKFAYDFAAAAGLEYSPDSQWVDLYLNGEYAGLYQLCERNELQEHRVDVQEAGSFLVSIEPQDRMIEQNYPHVTTQAGVTLRVHEPAQVSDAELSRIAEQLQSIENALLADDGIDPVTGKHWRDLIDEDSWARMYLLQEIFANGDAGISSQYFYFNAEDQKIYAGPIWDMDRSMGNSMAWHVYRPMVMPAQRLHAKDGMDMPWFPSLLSDNEFKQLVRTLYAQQLQPLLAEWLSGTFEMYYTQIKPAVQMDQLRWGRNQDRIDVSAEYIRWFMQQRSAFLNDIWIHDVPYHIVLADNGHGTYYAHYGVRHGECLTDLPTLTGFAMEEFVGWYDVETGQPFDETKPVLQDMRVCAHWVPVEQTNETEQMPVQMQPVVQEQSQTQQQTRGKTISWNKIWCAAGMTAFCLMFAIEFHRMKKGGWRR